MTVYRYTAVSMRGSAPDGRQTGEIAGANLPVLAYVMRQATQSPAYH